jgi:hypothetical protein
MKTRQTLKIPTKEEKIWGHPLKGICQEKKLNYYRLKAVGLDIGCKPTKALHQS